jgi:hypothetical protein
MFPGASRSHLVDRLSNLNIVRKEPIILSSSSPWNMGAYSKGKGQR